MDLNIATKTPAALRYPINLIFHSVPSLWLALRISTLISTSSSASIRKSQTGWEKEGWGGGWQRKSPLITKTGWNGPSGNRNNLMCLFYSCPLPVHCWRNMIRFKKGSRALFTLHWSPELMNHLQRTFRMTDIILCADWNREKVQMCLRLCTLYTEYIRLTYLRQK